MMIKKILLILIIMFQTITLSAHVVWGDDKLESIAHIKIPVIDGVEKYLDILNVPAYLAVALDNAGLGIGVEHNLNIESDKIFDWNGVSVEYIKRNGKIFFYDVNFITSFGKVLPEVRLKLDASNVNRGFFSVDIYSKYASVLLEKIATRFEPKVLMMFNTENQSRMMGYLQKINSRRDNKKFNFNEAILIEGYNNRSFYQETSSSSSESGNKSKNLIVLLYTITVALIIIPLYASSLCFKKSEKKEDEHDSKNREG